MHRYRGGNSATKAHRKQLKKGQTTNTKRRPNKMKEAAKKAEVRRLERKAKKAAATKKPAK